MKEIKITPPEGYVIDEEKSTIYNIVFKKKEKLPTTWEEFCKQNHSTKGEYFIAVTSDIVEYKNNNTFPRDNYCDRLLLSTKEDAEAHLALIQLHRLRDVYRQGWVPDWKNIFQPKFIITQFFNKAEVVEVNTANTFLSFQSQEIAEQFLENFEDLILEAKELI